jgi:hypothetical protein
MTYAEVVGSTVNIASSNRPLVESYDLGFEYSQQHYLALECMVEDADEEKATFARVPAGEKVAA